MESQQVTGVESRIPTNLGEILNDRTTDNSSAGLWVGESRAHVENCSQTALPRERLDHYIVHVLKDKKGEPFGKRIWGRLNSKQLTSSTIRPGVSGVGYGSSPRYSIVQMPINTWFIVGPLTE